MSKKKPFMPREGPWEQWDLLNHALAPLKKRYAKAALRFAVEIFGREILDPPIRLAVLESVEPYYETVMALTELKFKEQSK